MQRILINVVLANTLVAAGITSAMASTVALSDTTTSAGSTQYGANTPLVTPGSYFYGDTFAGNTGNSAVSSSLPDGFYDDFVFTISDASADSITSTITLGTSSEIDGLQAALFNYSTGQQLPVTGSPLAAGWSQKVNFGSTTATYSVIPSTTLSAGSYVLEVKGTVSGTAGGSYSGTLNLAPVPLPAGLPLLLSGLGFVGFWGRRRLK
jgi:hypothetical protein